MNKFISIILCFVIFTTLSACGKNQNNKFEGSINDIPSASADNESDLKDNENDSSEENANNGLSYSDEETEVYTVPDTNKTNLRSEKERIEIRSNLSDAKQLIDDGCYEDAMMIIKSLKTRKLSDEESKELTKLQEQMMHVSD